jgi:hypothetical protein
MKKIKTLFWILLWVFEIATVCVKEIERERERERGVLCVAGVL